MPFDRSLRLFENDFLRAAFSSVPTTPLQIDVELKNNSTSLSDLPQPIFLDVFSCIRQLALRLQRELNIGRFGLVSEGRNLVSLVPLHGIQAGSEWKPIMAVDTFFYGRAFPGFISSRNGKKMEEQELDEIRDELRAVSGLREEDIGKTLIGEHDRSNLFARLIEEDIPCWKYYDSPEHVAFLTPFPNTTGYSCVIPKRHHSSDILGMPEEPYRQLLAAGWEVAQLFKKAFKVRHVGFMMEGYEINHAHLKIAPIFDDQRVGGSPDVAWFERYSGYLTTQTGRQLSGDQEVAKLAELAVSLAEKLDSLL